MSSFIPKRKNIAVVVQTRDAIEAIAGLRRSTGSITFAANPAEADTVTIYGVIYEFHSAPESITEGNVYVELGADAEETAGTLAAILLLLTGLDSDTPLLIISIAAVEATIVMTLTYEQLGAAGNVALAKSGGDITVAGMTGGADGGVLETKVTGLATAAKQDLIQASLNEYLGSDLTFLDTVAINVDDATQVLKAAVAGEKVYVVGLVMNVTKTSTATSIQDTDATVLLDFGALNAGSIFCIDPRAMKKIALVKGTDAKGIQLVVAAGTINGVAYLATEDIS